MSKSSLFNTFLLSVCLAVLGWTGHKVASTAEAVASLQASTLGSGKANDEGHMRLERKLDETVPRREFDSKILQIEADLRKTEIRLREIDLELLRLKQKCP